MQRPPHTSGFSLIEILAVLALMAIILGIVSAGLKNGNLDQQHRAAVDQISAMIRQGASVAASSKDVLILAKVGAGNDARVVLLQVDLDRLNNNGQTFNPNNLLADAAAQPRDPASTVSVPAGLQVPDGILLGFRPDGTVVFSDAPASEKAVYGSPVGARQMNINSADPSSGAVQRRYILVITNYGNTTLCEDQCAAGVSE